jgi:phage tail sheath protein FI
MTDRFLSNVNTLTIPGQRDPLITDYALDKMSSYDLGLYLMDIPNYNSDGERIFTGETGVYVDIDQTAEAFENRALDTSFGATYFPDVQMDDTFTNRKVFVPATVAALAAIGYNDKVSYPWFAPAGFNRGALDFVNLTQARLKNNERERLYSIDVNPIVKFPGESSYVIFAQNTLRKGETPLQSINVQRMIGDLKRQIIDIGNRLIFEQITPELYGQIRKSFSDVLQVVQNRQGVEKFRVVCDNTNNNALDAENNKINCSIIFVPTRAIEFVAIDFIITRAGVEFV